MDPQIIQLLTNTNSENVRHDPQQLYHLIQQQQSQTRQLLEQQVQIHQLTAQLLRRYNANLPSSLPSSNIWQHSSINPYSLMSPVPPLEASSPLSTPSSIETPPLTSGIRDSIIEISRPVPFYPSSHSRTGQAFSGVGKLPLPTGIPVEVKGPKTMQKHNRSKKAANATVEETLKLNSSHLRPVQTGNKST